MPTLHAGIDIGGTYIKYGVLDDAGTILTKRSVPTQAEMGLDHVITQLQRIVHELHEVHPNLSTWGVGVPGVVDPSSRRVQCPPNLPGWDSVPLGDILRSMVDQHVVVENDANAAALAEYGYGAGKGHKDMLYVTLGTGVGGGVILNGRLHTGPYGDAGEIGHIIIRADIQPTEAERSQGRGFRAGVLEEFVGRVGILHTLQQTGLASTIPSETDIVDIVDLARAANDGNPVAREVLQQTATWLGLGLSSAMAVLGLRVVVVGGGISAAGEPLFLPLIQTIRERAIPTIAASFSVIPAAFGQDAGLIGAAFLPLHVHS